MKRVFLALSLSALLGAGVTTAACHTPTSITTQAGKTAYAADQIVVRVNELENAAIAANAGGALPTATTKTIVEFCVAADLTLKSTPAGWQATVQTAWTVAKSKIQTANPAITAAMSAIDVVLGVAQ